MNTYVSIALRDLACGAAAALITLILSASFVQSTSVPPGMHAVGPHTPHVFIALQPRDAWFGQPEPAVLVD
jgi:hypothetical protein